MDLILKTSLSEVMPLRVHGQNVYQLKPQLLALLKRNNVTTDKIEFAEPKISTSRGEIQWFYRSKRRYSPLDSVGKDASVQATACISEFVGAVTALADKLEATSGNKESNEVQLLRACVQGISADHTYYDGTHVLLCCWACSSSSEHEKFHAISALGVTADHARDETELKKDAQQLALKEEGDIEDLGANSQADYAPELDEEQPYQGEKRQWGWLWSVLMFLLLACLVLLFFRGCAPIGLPSFGLGNGGRLALESEIAALKNELANHGGVCTADNPTGIPSAEERLAGAGATAGEVNISLVWNNRHDLDLVVEDPLGELIYFENRKSASGGYLDVDQNAGRKQTKTPIENIKWDDIDAAPRGTYKVYVVYFAQNSNDVDIDPTEYQVATTVNDEITTTSGAISKSQLKEQVFVTSFELK